MSSTLLRLGLWVILLVVVLYVLQQTYEEAPFVDFFAPAMLQKALALGGILVAAGIVMRILERGAKVVVKNRCVVCKTPIEHGAIYCREHLRRMLNREDDRTHRTRVVKRNRSGREQRRRQSDQEHVHDHAARNPQQIEASSAARRSTAG